MLENMDAFCIWVIIFRLTHMSRKYIHYVYIRGQCVCVCTHFSYVRQIFAQNFLVVIHDRQYFVSILCWEGVVLRKI